MHSKTHAVLPAVLLVFATALFAQPRKTLANPDFSGDKSAGMSIQEGAKRGDLNQKGRDGTTKEARGEWLPVESGIADDLRQVFFVNRDIGWILGDKGIYKSLNGGRTWHLQWGFSGGVSVISMVFPNPREGWLDTRISTSWHTRDGGVSWTPDTSKVPLRPIFFMDKNAGWGYVADGGSRSFSVESLAAGVSSKNIGLTRIIHTVDGGKTWKMIGGVRGVSVRGLGFSGAEHGWLFGESAASYVAGDFTQDLNVFVTMDGGRTWELRSEIAGFPGAIKSLQFRDSQKGWMVLVRETKSEFTRVLRRTTDGGFSWEDLPEFSRLSLHSVNFVDSEHGWALGALGIFGSKDAGRTWELASGTLHSFNAFYFLNGRVGWAVGNDGTVFRYQAN